ncbi:hypothetical protein BGW38_008617 [Lunasporangiospora selenospora]|uniref:Translin n=1 Tax=Lunasporangiospora selenospora TaxID=979761 RepID=A0A9P6G4A8_9FUNG|nr:hypothetical protein BGW38_008617 [Lunasporangiospora selenospora]
MDKDVHMQTPPASSTTVLENRPLESLEQNEASPRVTGAANTTDTTSSTRVSSERETRIRSSLGESIFQDFGIYRDILDEHHERRERIIKVSRDINNFSKKMIFALHRAEPKEFLPQQTSESEALTEFREKRTTVLKLIHRVALDLQGPNYHRYQRSVSGALQEYIEAMTLEYYLVHGSLMPKKALEADLVFDTTQEQLDNHDLIIGLGQPQYGGGSGSRGGGGGNRGKFGKDNRRTPYNRDKEKDRENEKRGREPTSTERTTAGDVPTTAEPTTSMTVDDDKDVPLDTTSIPKEVSPVLARVTLEITDEDYLLGVADLTGELMRLAFNALGQSIVSAPASYASSTDESHLLLSSPEERVQHILRFLREIKSGIDGLTLTRASPISKKMTALKQSLNKIEVACYNVKVRGAEYPPEMMKQLLMSGGSDIGGEGNGANMAAGDDEDD